MKLNISLLFFLGIFLSLSLVSAQTYHSQGPYANGFNHPLVSQTNTTNNFHNNTIFYMNFDENLSLGSYNVSNTYYYPPVNNFFMNYQGGSGNFINAQGGLCYDFLIYGYNHTNGVLTYSQSANEIFDCDYYGTLGENYYWQLVWDALPTVEGYVIVVNEDDYDSNVNLWSFPKYLDVGNVTTSNYGDGTEFSYSDGSPDVSNNFWISNTTISGVYVDVPDLSGNNYDGKIRNNITQVPSPYGKGLYFNYSQRQFIDVNNVKFGKSNKSMTFSFLEKTNTSAFQFFLGGNQYPPYSYSGWEFDTNNQKARFYYLTGSSGSCSGYSYMGTHNIGIPLSQYADNRWHLITGTINGTTDAIYFDGVYIGGGDNGGCEMYDPDALDPSFSIGAAGFDAQNRGDNFDGSIDEVLILNRTLSPSEILALNNSLAPRFNSKTQITTNYINLTNITDNAVNISSIQVDALFGSNVTCSVGYKFNLSETNWNYTASSWVYASFNITGDNNYTFPSISYPVGAVALLPTCNFTAGTNNFYTALISTQNNLTLKTYFITPPIPLVFFGGNLFDDPTLFNDPKIFSGGDLI